jgi:hypothetical protein
MGATKGNQFWQLRSKHGRGKLFESPELLWEAACEYFQWCIDNPFQKSEAKVVNIGDYQSEVQKVNLDVMRPFTMNGLCIYLDCSSSYFRVFKHEDRVNKEEFLTVITRIEEIIYDQKFTGAASGFFNANIIARDLGLTDKKDINHSVSEMPDWMKDE